MDDLNLTEIEQRLIHFMQINNSVVVKKSNGYYLLHHDMRHEKILKWTVFSLISKCAIVERWSGVYCLPKGDDGKAAVVCLKNYKHLSSKCIDDIFFRWDSVPGNTDNEIKSGENE